MKFDSINAKAVQKIQSNLYLFSGVKTYQQLTEMNSLLVDKNGKIRGYESFKREVFKVHNKYNKTYLQAEYNTAKASAQTAKQWQKYQADENCTHLKYKTVGDSKVRDEHEKLNNVVKAKNDPFWDTYLPLNGWNCRCYVVCTKSEVTKDKKFIEIDKRFQNNVGKTNTIFNEKHPYFSIQKADKKQVETLLEHWKIEYPQYVVRHKAKNGATVSVSSFADSSAKELIGNYKVAIKIADELKMSVKLRPHINGEILLNKSNPEYLINTAIADRKSPKGLNVRNVIRKAHEQGSEIIVFDLHDNKNTEAKVLEAIKNRLKKPEHYKNIKEVILISKDRKVVKHYFRKDL